MALTPFFDELANSITRDFAQRNWDDDLAQAMASNDLDALSLLLSRSSKEPRMQDHLEQMSQSLLRRALPADAAECSLLLLNFLEERRRAKQQLSEASQPQGEDDAAERKRKREMPVDQRLRMVREDYIFERERHCGEAPKSRQLLTLAAQAMKQSPPAQRCARALLLQAHRLRKKRPQVGKQLLGCDGDVLLDSEGQPGIPWPSTPADLPKALTAVTTEHGGHGGFDLSLGAEAMPLQWVNEVDGQLPPPIVFVRRCIDVDVHADWAGKLSKHCSRTQQEQPSFHSADPCADVRFHTKPDGHEAECNWHCLLHKSCDARCSRRSLQRGAAHRLQVFKHPMKGWCLRTLTPIPKDAFIMEYAAERISPERGHGERVKDDPDFETYVMELDRSARGYMQLDALVVRNHAAFAAFACTKRLANMVKKKVLTQHWDPKVPHVGFFAVRDIEPMEELSYLRQDVEPSKTSHRNCNCCHPECSGRL